ncbi:MAG: hypothetical protein Ct9H90mP9_1650 [Pseudomonadota bacterium]|nr:MAG: hypothetical protein Ct9H90mP9_1650 [Pseudomonadota bacterium]
MFPLLPDLIFKKRRSYLGRGQCHLLPSGKKETASRSEVRTLSVIPRSGSRIRMNSNPEITDSPGKPRFTGACGEFRPWKNLRGKEEWAIFMMF